MDSITQLPKNLQRYVVQADLETLAREKRPIKLSVESQGHLFKARLCGLPARGGGVRGKVAGFSGASRKRMIDKMARLNPQPVPGFRAVGLFVTLTYAGKESDLPEPEQVKRDLDVFIKRLRRAFPGCSGMWRFEWDSSGKRQYHPHIHLILFGVGFISYMWIRSNWNDVVGQSPNAHSEDVTSIRSWRGVLSYVSKYMTKMSSGSSLPSSPVGGVGPLSFVVDAPGHPWLVYGAYLTGRCWGVINADNLPVGDLVRYAVEVEEFGAFFDLKRAGRRRWAGVNRHAMQGFTLFCDNPGDWVSLAAYFIAGGASCSC